MSMGYFISRNQEFPSVRITFRVHTGPRSAHTSQKRTFSATEGAIHAIERFICSGGDATQQEFVRIGGLRFLMNLLVENRCKLWTSYPYGAAFETNLKQDGVQIKYPREDVLFFIRSLTRFIATNERMVTESSLRVLESLASIENNDLQRAVVRTLEALCLQADAHSQESVEVNSPTSVQSALLNLGGVLLVRRVLDKLPVGSVPRNLLEDSLFKLLLLAPACTQEGLLVHLCDWTKYYIQLQGHTRTSLSSRIELSLLARIHAEFFDRRFEPRDSVKCSCGCRQTGPGLLTSAATVVGLSCFLIKHSRDEKWVFSHTEFFVDLVQFTRWISSTPEPASPATVDICGKICCTLKDASTSTACSPDLAVSLFASVTAEILETVKCCTSHSIRTELLQVIGILLHRAIADRVSELSPSEFLYALVKLVSALEGVLKGPSFSSQFVKISMLHEDPSNAEQVNSTVSMASYLHDEHLAKSAKGARSILQSIITLVMARAQPVDSPHSSWTVLMLLALCSALEEAKVARELSDENLEQELCQFVTDEERPSIERVLAARALTLFYFHAKTWPSWCSSLTTEWPQLFNVIVGTLHRASKLSASERVLAIHIGSDGYPLVGADAPDWKLISSWYAEELDMLSSKRAEGDFESRSLETVTRGLENSDDVAMDKVFVHLKLLVVVSNTPELLMPPMAHDEVRTLLAHLCVSFILRT